MSEQLLDGPQVGAVAQQVGGVGVAEGVRVQGGVGREAHGVLLHDALDGTDGEARAATAEQHRSGGRPGTGLKLALQGLGGLDAEGNLAFLASLATDAEPALVPVQVVEVESGELADAESTAVEQFEDDPVSTEALGGGRVDELVGLLG